MPPTYVPLWISPSGRLGYLPIHKNASTSFQYHFQRNLKWGRAWPAHYDLAKPEPYVANPNPEKILVITRDPIERWESGMRQIDFWTNPSWDAVPWDDPHVWTQGRFVAQWRQFYDRMEFVDLADANLWLEMNLVPRCDERRNVRSDREETQAPSS